jgi:hypothetical protein
MFIHQLKAKLKWFGINIVYKLKDVLPKKWYYRLLQWLIKTSLLTYYEKVCIRIELKWVSIYSMLESIRINVVKYFS